MTGALLIGRDEELAEIHAFLRGWSASPCALLLEGEAGIGKTTLWRAGQEAAGKYLFRVLTAHAGASESELPFTALGDLLEGQVTGVLPDLPDPQRRALEIALLLEDPGSTAPEPRTIGTALLGAFRQLARERPLLVAIDDVQWLDAASRDALEFVFRRLSDEPIALLLTRRGEPDEPLPLGLGRAPADDVTRLRIGPLSVGALGELLRTRLGLSWPRPTLRRLADESGGNPFFALEFARTVQRRGLRVEPGEPLPVPATLQELVADRLVGLPPRTHETLLVVALASDPTVELLGCALEGDPWERLAPAVQAEVVELEGDSIRFTHPLVASVVKVSVDVGRRRDAHRLLAEVVAAPEERGWHLALATRTADAEVAGWVEQAAATAAARGAPAAAASLLEHAWRLTPKGACDALDRQVAAARLHRLAGDAQRAEGLLHRALPEAPPGIARARVLYELEESEFFTRGALQAVRRSHEALRELERSPEGGLALQASIHFNLALGLRGTRDLSSARQHSEAAVELARRAEDASVLAEATAVAAMLQFDAGEPGSIALGRHALTIAGGPPGLVTHCLGHQLLWSGRFAQARPLFEELQREMSVRGDTNEGVVRWYLANLELRAGNWRQACEHAESVSELAVQNGWVGDSLLLHSSAQLAAYQGDLHAAVTRAHRGVALAEAEGSPFGRAVYGGVLGLVELSRDDHRTACAHLEAANEVLEAAGIREPGLLSHAGAETRSRRSSGPTSRHGRERCSIPGKSSPARWIGPGPCRWPFAAAVFCSAPKKTFRLRSRSSRSLWRSTAARRTLTSSHAHCSRSEGRSDARSSGVPPANPLSAPRRSSEPRRGGVGREGAPRARPDRGTSVKRRCTDAQGAEVRGAGRGGPLEQGDRSRPLRDAEKCGHDPLPHLCEARRPLAYRARASTRAAGEQSVGICRLSPGLRGA